MPYTRLAALALAMTTFMIAGCGDSPTKKASGPVTGASNVAETQHSAPVSTSGKQLTRAELIAQGDAICRRLNKQAATLVTVSLHTVGSTALPLAGYYRAAIAELHKLTPPAGMAQAWRAIVSDVQLVPSAVTTMGRFALDNDMASTVTAELRLQKIQRHRTTIALHNGFTDCAEV